MSEMITNALRELVKQECYWLKQKIDSFQGGKYAIFPAGPTAQQFFYTLKNEFGIEAEFFIDNNPVLEGKVICGKPVMSFKTLTGEENILVPTAFKYYKQIAVQLEAAGIFSYMYANTFVASQLWDRYDKVADMLGDEQSKSSYWGAIYSIMTENCSFIIWESENDYFGLQEFRYNLNEIIVDAGANVGDTVEEYVRRGHGKVKIFSFEPFQAMLEKIKARVSQLEREWVMNDGWIEIIPAGVGEKTKISNFSFDQSSLMLIPNEEGEMSLPIYSLDDFFKDKPPFTILKADIEGGEMGMLKGAQEMIKRYKPKMTLCIYHSPQDFAQIAEYVHSLVPEYRLYVRSHGMNYQGTILYCVI